MVEKDNEFAFLNFYPYYWEGGKLKAFIYSERPLYKPGQTVLGKAILREVSTDKYIVPPPGEKVEVALVDYRDNEYGKESLPFTPEGECELFLFLPQKIEEGYFLIRLRWRDREFYQVISIENYEKPVYCPVRAGKASLCPGRRSLFFTERRVLFPAPFRGGVNSAIRYSAILLATGKKKGRGKCGEREREN